MQVWCTPGWTRSVLNVTFYKTLFLSARLGHARGTSHARGLHGLTFPGPRPHADDPRPCGRGLRCMGRLFGSTVKRAPNIRIRWRPPSAHQAAAAAGRAIGAPHRYHRSALPPLPACRLGCRHRLHRAAVPLHGACGTAAVGRPLSRLSLAPHTTITNCCSRRSALLGF